MSEKEIQQNAAKAAEFEAEEFTFQDDEQRARYYKVLSEGYKTLWMDEASKFEREKEENTRLVVIGESLVDEVTELKAKVSELNGYLEDRHKYIEELEMTLGLRNRSNPDLTIDDEL